MSQLDNYSVGVAGADLLEKYCWLAGGWC